MLFQIEGNREKGEIMTVWHVKKLYHDNDVKYTVLPYNLFSTIKITCKMERGFRATMKFLKNSRLMESTAEKLVTSA